MGAGATYRVASESAAGVILAAVVLWGCQSSDERRSSLDGAVTDGSVPGVDAGPRGRSLDASVTVDASIARDAATSMDACGPCFAIDECHLAVCSAADGLCRQVPVHDGLVCGELAMPSICVVGECVPRGCGDGYREPGPEPLRESCDDENARADDLCTPACESRLYVVDESPEGDFSARPSWRAPVIGGDGTGQLLAVWLRDYFDHERLVARRFDGFGGPARVWQEGTSGTDGGDAGVGDAGGMDGGSWVLADEVLVVAEGLPTPSNAAPSVAGLAGGGWVVAWARPALGGGDIVYRLVASDGTLGVVRAAAQATEDLQSDPWVVPLGEGFFIGWVTAADSDEDPDGGVRGRRFGADGLPASAETTLATMREGVQSELALTSTGDTVLAVWEHASGAVSALRARRFGPKGALDVSDVELRSGASSPALSVLADGDFALAFVTTEDDALGDVHVGRVAADSAPVLVDVEPLADEPELEERRPTLAGGPKGGVMVTWESGFPLEQFAAPALGAAPAVSEWGYIEAALSVLALSRGSVSSSPRGVWFAFEGIGDVRSAGALSLYLLSL